MSSGGWYRPGGLASGPVLSRGSFFEVEVGEQVDARALDVLVAEPKCDNAGVDADFQGAAWRRCVAIRLR